jgi:DNA-binding SARP family transcriptional activator/thioredoxin-like negative regulator of GroEL
MEFRILGPLEVVEDGRPVSLDRRRMRALLAFLLLHANELVSADRLIDEVWGPEPPKTASASLQNYVSRLRKAIGADAVVSQPPGYVLRIDPERFDLARFERLTSEARGAEPRERAEKLRAALALWRGPALDDLAFEPFARDEVGRLEEARLAALEDCIDAELELGRDGDLVGELETLVEEHPLRERFRAQLMRALYRAGRQADALAAFQDAREVLTEELGLEPGEELRTLQQAILRQDPALDAAGDAGAQRGPDRRTVTVLFCDLVGSSELAARLDPEAYRALLSRYFELVRGPIERHGGTLEKFIGDAVLAVFGVPELHEDDALRAVRAAVEAQAALRDAEIAARIGVSSGEVHVLSAPGEPLHVSGAPASVAAQLEGRAPSGNVVLDDATYARVRDALRADEQDGVWLVRDVVPGAPAYARRLDAPLVGRAQELERLRAAYDDASRSGRCSVVTVVGEAGIGKTRLLRELLVPLREKSRILVGRCVSYGEGATYLPIAEAVRQVAPSVDAIAALLAHEDDGGQVAQRVAELTGLADAPPAPGDAFWAVRRFFEAVARERPSVLVLDDIHWAEPTLLDLVEYLGEWTEAPLLVLCAARRELLESRPGWGGPTSTGFVVELGRLDEAETAELLEALTDAPIEADAAQRIVEQSGGNPLFAEQLLALVQEAPELAGETPATVEALVASRLDRLDPRERSVLRRASVIGRRFTKPELADLTPRTELSRTERDLAALAQRALIHPREHVFAFHHVLVRDVAYRSIPKSERAELHALAARGLDRRDAPAEIVGYHFEQAHRYVGELSLGRDRAQELAVAGGEQLGRAGIRAFQRADVPAAANLLRRALALTPDAHDLACELGLALNVMGERLEAMDVFRSVIERADDHHKLRAETELGWLRSLGEPDYARTLLDACARAIPVHEAAGDYRALGRAWFGISHVRGGFFCEYAAMEEAGEQMVACYGRARWPLAGPLEVLGTALEFGPRPVDDAIARLRQLAAQDTSRWIDANVALFVGRLEAMRTNFDAARAELERARNGFTELALPPALGDTCKRAAAAVEFAAGDFESAATALREACEFLERQGESQVLATRAAEHANVLCAAGRYEEAAQWMRIARDKAGADDLDAALTRQPVEALLSARDGHVDEAERLARAAVQLAAATDSPNRRADALVALAEVLALAGAEEEAREHLCGALALYEQKGNLAAGARVRAQTESPVRGSPLDVSTA